MELFPAPTEENMPLAARLRPSRLHEVMGQPHIAGENGFLARCVRRGQIPSLILWGPPGTGKTTLAEVLAHEVDAPFFRLSAVLSGVKELRSAIASAENELRLRQGGRHRPLLFVDEIHRYNKSQQDALLPHIERGTFVLLGATTENPSFEVNAALLSRARVLAVRPLEEEALSLLLDRALSMPQGLAEHALAIAPDARNALIESAQGDGRRLLTSLEVAADFALAGAAHGETNPRQTIDLSHVEEAVGRRMVLFDKSGEQHYNVISALIKSLRGSDPDAALHYLARLLEAGEDPRFILRRLVIFASEDIGNADPRALQVAVAAQQAFDFVGLPEGALSLAQATTFLATCPKSNASYVAINEAREDVRRQPDTEIPLHLTNAPTPLMKKMGYGEGYLYPHDFPGNHVEQNYLPEKLQHRRYYRPTDNGLEKNIGERLSRWRKSTS